MEEEVKIGFRDRVLMNVPLTQKMLLAFYGAIIGFIAQLYLVSHYIDAANEASLSQQLNNSLALLASEAKYTQEQSQLQAMLQQAAGKQFTVSLKKGAVPSDEGTVSGANETLSLNVLITLSNSDTLAQGLLESTAIYGLACLVLVFFLASSVSSNLIPLIGYIIEVMQVIASGKLDRKVGFSGDDEFGQLGGAIDGTLGNISELIELISKSTNELNQSASGIIEQSAHVSESEEKQAHNIEAVTQSMSTMKLSIQEVTQSAEEATLLADQSNSNANNAKNSVQSSISVIEVLSQNIHASALAVKNLEENADKIGSVIEVINGISEQTNLLALNAAIEAARAGEQGRGFAVVADEVRTLAQRTQGATVEIKTMIEALQEGSNQVAQYMGESVDNASKSLAKINAAISEIDQITIVASEISAKNASIYDSMQSQSHSANNINQNLDEIQLIANKNLEQVNRILEGNDLIETTASNLSEALKRYS